MTASLKRFAFRKFRDSETKLHELNYLFWECTARCNLNCLHCGSDCSKAGTVHDMPLADFLSALDTVKMPANNFIVVLTGGEPLLRSDIECCGREIRKRGMKWGIVSNGYLYTEAKHISLLNSGLGALTLSLDGLEKSHNWLRNNIKSFQRVDRAIDLAVSSKRLYFDVVTCVNQRNIQELSLIGEYLAGKGVKSWRLFTIAPIGRAKNNPLLCLTGSQFHSVLDFIAESRKQKSMDVKFSCEGFVGEYETKVRDSYFFCRAGINIGSILVDGSISACPNIDRTFAQGNIYRDNFYQTWQTKYVEFRNRSWTKTGMCAACDDYRDCRGNGMHFWHGDKRNVLVCHKEQLRNAT